MALLKELGAAVEALEKASKKARDSQNPQNTAETALKAYAEAIAPLQEEMTATKNSSNVKIKLALETLEERAKNASAELDKFTKLGKSVSATASGKEDKTESTAKDDEKKGLGHLSRAIAALQELKLTIENQKEALLANTDLEQISTATNDFQAAFEAANSIASASKKGSLARLAPFKKGKDEEQLGELTALRAAITALFETLQARIKELKTPAVAAAPVVLADADAPAPVVLADAPAPAVVADAPAPVDLADAPAPVDLAEAPAPVDLADAPAPVDLADAPAPAVDTTLDAQLVAFTTAMNKLNRVTFTDPDSEPAMKFAALVQQCDNLPPAQKANCVVLEAMEALFTYSETLSRSVADGAEQPAIDVLKQERADARKAFEDAIVDMPGHANALVQRIGKAFMAISAAITIALVASPLLALVSVSAAAAIALPAACIIPAAASAVTTGVLGLTGFFGARSTGAHREARGFATMAASLDEQTAAAATTIAQAPAAP